MATSKAKSVQEYLAELPEDRRKAIEAVRKVIQKNLPTGYEEVMQYGMITYVVPLSRYSKGYCGNKNIPLPYLSLASQKNYMSLYLLSVYITPETESWFQKAYEASGKKLDMGKSCVRFKKLDDLPLDVIGKVVAKFPAEKWIEIYENLRKK